MTPPKTERGTRPVASGVGKTTGPATYGKDLEAALDEYIRTTKGLTFDSVALRMGIDGETLRRMLDPGDRLQLGVSRLLKLMRALGPDAVAVVNAWARLDGHQVGGDVYQLMPQVRRATGQDILRDIASGAREGGEILEAVMDALADGTMTPSEATEILKLYRPHLERHHSVVGQLETVAGSRS